MNIISQKDGNVKRKNKKNQLVGWQMHKQLGIEIANKLMSVGLIKRGARMKECGSFLQFDRCADCGKIMIRNARLCRDRLCPTCNWRLSLKRYSGMSRVMQNLFQAHPEYTYSLVTLTAKNCDGESLGMYMSEMQTAYNRCISQRWARQELKGWARSIEVTYNTKTKQLHPHYHIILACPLESTAHRLVAEWLRQCDKRGIGVSTKAQNVSMICENHEAGESLATAVCEVYKYAVKSNDLSKMDAKTLLNLAKQLGGKRLISSGGLIKQYMAMLEIADLDSADDEENDIEICTECGSVSLDHLVAAWSMQGGRYNIKTFSEEERVRDIVKELDNNMEMVRDEIAKSMKDNAFSTQKLQKAIENFIISEEKR